MFVRWQGKGTRWSAILVESQRVNGKVRQQHLAYLGSIDETQRRKDVPLLRFWGRRGAFSTGLIIACRQSSENGSSDLLP